MLPEQPTAIAILANDPSTMYYGGQDDGELCMMNETPMTDMMLDEDRVHGLGNIPLDEPGDIHLGDLGAQANHDGVSDDTSGAPQTYNENAISVTGAGASSTYFAMQSSQAGSTAGHEFAKSRTWRQQIVEELKDLIHILAADGRVLYISNSVQHLTGYTPEDITGKSIVDFIHLDDRALFIREFNNSITTGASLRLFYRFRKQSTAGGAGDYALLECHGHPHPTSGAAATSSSQNNPPAAPCTGFFLTSRPYPTKHAALLDSFLEHKIENERLVRKIEALRREDAEGLEEYQQAQPQQPQSHLNKAQQDVAWEQYGSASQENNAGMRHPSSTDHHLAMPPPVKAPSASTRQTHDDASAPSNPDSGDDKPLLHSASTIIETIEMITGLRYRDGERSRGISTGDAAPTLIRGDVGAAGVAVDREGRGGGGGDKKKKVRGAEKYVCTDCGTLDSPEWRKGPQGAKTLCNACGLRWAKQEKKRSGGGFNFNNGSSGGGDQHL
ncbi:hypothetical protein VE03_04969 [Pseudogymnoascus sp. 23342-1-I1]|nr:hypothetical protein VE03_04969 [Pseudogymnoascus sp. 23342-1-I1]